MMIVWIPQVEHNFLISLLFNSMFRAASLRRLPALLTVSGMAQQLTARRKASLMNQGEGDDQESEEERQHWQERKAVCGFCAFFLDSPCARTFKPWCS
jgi:hypothetical protein